MEETARETAQETARETAPVETPREVEGSPAEAIRLQHPRCPYCHSDVTASDRKAACDSCMAWQHEACWIENGSCCATCGAREAVGARLESSRHPGRPGKPVGACEVGICREPVVGDLSFCQRHGHEHVLVLSIVIGLFLAVSLLVLLTFGFLATWKGIVLGLLPVAPLIWMRRRTRRGLSQAKDPAEPSVASVFSRSLSQQILESTKDSSSDAESSKPE